MDYFDEIGSSFKIELITNFEIHSASGGDFSAIEIGLIDILINGKSQPTEVAVGTSPCAIDLEVGVDVSFAAYAS